MSLKKSLIKLAIPLLLTSNPTSTQPQPIPPPRSIVPTQVIPTQQTPAKLVHMQDYTHPVFHTQGTLKVYTKPTSPPKATAVWNDGRNYTKQTYMDTVSRDKVIERLEQERRTYQIADTAINIATSAFGITNFHKTIGVSLEDIL
ncbi:hypothetical protein CL618_01145, partial [archaeon]|nr:hypothetical protein [archaeon]